MERRRLACALPMITACILNWKRPENVTLILNELAANPLISQRIVWNNNPECLFKSNLAQVINCNQDMGLYTRFLAGMLAENEAVLIQDDDLLAGKATIGKLYEHWLKTPDIVHGIFGRRPRPDGSYAADVLGDEECPIVLTRCLMVHRKYFPDFFSIIGDFRKVQQASIPNGNGEDIIFSRMVINASRQMNRVHKLEVEELAAIEAIHTRSGWQAHVDHRTAVMRFCDKYFSD